MTTKTNILTLLFIISGIFSAVGFGETPTKCSGYEKGTITFKNGKTKETYIYIDYCNPQLFQSSVRTINENTYNQYQQGNKISNKIIEKYKVKEIKSFKLDNGKEFRQVKYANMYSTKNSDKLPKSYLLEVVADGKIIIYRKYYRTNYGFIYQPVLDSRMKGGKEHLDFMTNNFELLYQKDKDKNAKNIRNANLKKLFGDNAKILKSFQKGNYSFRTEFQKPATFSANCNIVYLNSLLEMVNDYNGKS